MQTTRRRYRIKRERIGFVKFILEAYDNLAVMSTLDSRQAVVQISIAPGCERVVEEILQSLAGGFEAARADGSTSVESAVESGRRPAGGNDQAATPHQENDSFDGI